ncbi:hypothetical protein CJJ23_03240 [Mycoplasmopsis agassizii]|uniref:ABC transporter domain-containing protein n=1 Tax=Mycoplasmopsis agassizii TaxID=33922 RepID=A0A269TIA7_9BACT|nr:hypothetical protein CJJ23_03240 [Mycoplasmopsis agassizii]
MFLSFIELNNISASYKNSKEELLKNINLKLDKNEFIAIIGSSGAGKTSLFNLLINHLKITEGDFLVYGENIKKFSKNDLKKYVKSFAFLNQSPNLIFEDDVYKNLKRFYNLQENKFFRFFNIITKQDFENIKKILKTLSIEDFIFTPVGNLSGGQKQRVELSKIFLQKPQIILADEPTTGLDVNIAEDVINAIKYVATTENILTLINIHDLGLINKQVFTKVIGLKNGIIFKTWEIDDFSIDEAKKIYQKE